MMETGDVLERASRHDFKAVIDWLALGGDPNATYEKEAGKHWSLLHWLAEAEAKGSIAPDRLEKLTTILLNYGANPHQGENAGGITGDTPFNIAAPSSPVTGRLMTNQWLAQALQGQGPKGLTDRSGSHGSTLAQYIAKWSNESEINDQLEKAQAAGMNLAVQNNDGWTPLHAAAAMGRAHAVEAFSRLYTVEQRNLPTLNPYSAPYGVNFPAGATAIALAQARINQLNDIPEDLQRCIGIMQRHNRAYQFRDPAPSGAGFGV